MKSISLVLICLLLAFWIGIMAIVSVQNATLVQLSIFTFQSIRIPLGIILGTSVSIGLIGGAVLVKQ
jgi:uncharacterized integral membrane protein